jgi:basic amino acid/polyamine antiporter, APA family
MSSDFQGAAAPTAASRDARPAEPPIYARKATGMVREIPLLSAMAFNWSIIPVAVALAAFLFGVFAAFPGANIIIALIIAIVTIPFVAVAFALLSATMPRIGGDYLYGSRIVHPAFGMASNLTQFAATVLGTAASAYFFPKAGLPSLFATVGVLTKSTGWLNAATTISRSGWVFATTTFLVIAMTVLSIYGTKVVTKVVAWCYFISLGSVILALLVLVFTSKSSFIAHLNTVSRPYTHAPDTYHATIAAAVKGGLQLPSHGGYSVRNTIGATFITLGVAGALWYSVYLAAEMKGAGQRRRQLTVVLGSSISQALFLLICVAVFLNATGYDFFASASSGFYAAPAPPYYNFFAGVAAHSPFLGILVTALLLFGFPAIVYANLGVAQRIPFAWAFDGLIPRRFASVNPRTHTPNVAIIVTGILCVAMCAWAAFAASFLQVITYADLLGFGPIVPVGICAALLPYRRPDLYRGSPAEWSIGPIPVITVAGIGAAAVGLFEIVLVPIFHAQLGNSSAITPIAVLVGCALLGAAIYVVAGKIQARRGVDLARAYQTLPAD